MRHSLVTDVVKVSYSDQRRADQFAHAGCTCGWEAWARDADAIDKQVRLHERSH